MAGSEYCVRARLEVVMLIEVTLFPARCEIAGGKGDALCVSCST